MFGYISPVLSVLSDEQRTRYRQVYCGLCRALKRKTGSFGRVFLSNDMTFLAILLNSFYEPEAVSGSSRCVLHPLRSHPTLASEWIDYAADMNILLWYYKCVDQRMDDRSPAGQAGMALLGKQLPGLRERFPRQAEAVASALDEIWSHEKDPSPNPDLLCNLSGRMLGAVFVPREEDLWAGALRAVGEGLGRFIYWMDAWEDYDEDIRRGRFNPLTRCRSRDDYESFCRDVMELLLAEAVESFETLPLEQDLDLLRNILYSGVWQRYLLLNQKKHGKEESQHE